jgi:GLPGLI family protein
MLTLINDIFRFINRHIGCQPVVLQKNKIMKPSALPFIASLMFVSPISISAQQQEGVITYEVKMKVPSMHGDPQDQGEAKYFTNHNLLYFNSTESLYVPAPDEETEFNSGEGLQIRIVAPQNDIYFNTSNSSMTALMEFMGKKYLVSDSIRMKSWKFGSETKSILGYSCNQATFKDDSTQQDLLAWYTSKLRPSLGPEQNNTLPGTILELDIDQGKRIILASNIELRPLKKGEIRIPKGGNPMTGPDFNKMMKDQVAEMRKNGDQIMISH